MLKKLYRSTIILVPAILVLGMGIQFFSCKKADTKGVIKVVLYETGTVVSGATVKMFVDSSNSDVGFFLCGDKVITPELIETTPSDGKITKCFEEPALISVVVTYTDGSGVNFVGEGKLNLEKYETTTITIKLI